MFARSIVLIGMPGAGKSTVGAVLARMQAMPFIDTDELIEAAAGLSLQTLVDQRGVDALRRLEEDVICALPDEPRVIATGGSAVYSDAAMAHLQRLGVRVYLRLELSALERRIDNFAQRGLARRPDQSLADLYRERVPLYERYADLTIDCAGKTAAAVATTIIDKLNERFGN